MPWLARGGTYLGARSSHKKYILKRAREEKERRFSWVAAGKPLGQKLGLGGRFFSLKLGGAVSPSQIPLYRREYDISELYWN